MTPALPVVDASPPTAQELEFDTVLTRFTASHIPLETTDGIKTRERVLNRLGELSRTWIESVCRRLLLPKEMITAAGGQLFTSGSYRLGIHEPHADIDVILVAPSMCTREDFFGSSTGYTNSAGEEIRDPESLAERIRKNPHVTNFNAVETAAVPILEFDFEGINIDLLFARLSSPTVPRDLDIDNDSVIGGVDHASATSLNGPRVTNMIASAVSGTMQRYQTFLQVVRCVRKWAKARGLYSNKMGYWGGVNINIAVAFCIQLYPNSSPSSLLRKFFLVFKTWRWPNPIMLTKPHDAKLGLPVWTPQQALLGAMQRQVAPIITPAYPAMNSTLSVSRQTLQIFQEEINRGHAIIDKLWKDFKEKGMAMPGAADGSCFESLFESSDFFISYPHYLSVCIVGPTQYDTQSWAGFVESRLRKLVSDQLGKSLPLSKIQLWPKKFEACIADKLAAEALTEEQRRYCLTYFIGFQVDTLRMKGTQLNVEAQLQKFKEFELNKFRPSVIGQDIVFRAYRVKELPRLVFDDVYQGGKVSAMKRRKNILLADPKRQEAKRRAKVAELKAKMAAVQQKMLDKQIKSSKDAGIAKEEIQDISKVKLQTSDGDTLNHDEGGFKEDEADLLENALDNLQDTAPCGKTREEAELERQKLLAGELLVVGAGESDDEVDDIGASDEGFKPSKHNKRSIAETEAEILRRAGFNIVSDEEAILLDPSILPHWKQPRNSSKEVEKLINVEVKLFTKFDVVELDSNGFVIDKGDADFIPSKTWIGRKGGFEFKLAERGLGYYRTGTKVVVPSNIAYK